MKTPHLNKEECSDRKKIAGTRQFKHWHSKEPSQATTVRDDATTMKENME